MASTFKQRSRHAPIDLVVFHYQYAQRGKGVPLRLGRLLLPFGDGMSNRLENRILELRLLDRLREICRPAQGWAFCEARQPVYRGQHDDAQ